MVDSLDELKSSRSVCGKNFPNFEMLDAKITSALNKIIQNSQFKKKVCLEEQKAQKEDRLLRGRQIAFMIYDYFREHSVCTHFPKDPNCEICLKTLITRASCRRRAGTVMPRAENFGDFITAEHKVLSEENESGNNHRYAVVVQDLATQWLQSYPCKTKTSHETQTNLVSFLEPARKPKSHLHCQFLGIWQVLRGFVLESLYVHTTQIRNQCDC